MFIPSAILLFKSWGTPSAYFIIVVVVAFIVIGIFRVRAPKHNTQVSDNNGFTTLGLIEPEELDELTRAHLEAIEENNRLDAIRIKAWYDKIDNAWFRQHMDYVAIRAAGPRPPYHRLDSLSMSADWAERKYKEAEGPATRRLAANADFDALELLKVDHPVEAYFKIRAVMGAHDQEDVRERDFSWFMGELKSFHEIVEREAIQEARDGRGELFTVLVDLHPGGHLPFTTLPWGVAKSDNPADWTPVDPAEWNELVARYIKVPTLQQFAPMNVTSSDDLWKLAYTAISNNSITDAKIALAYFNDPALGYRYALDPHIHVKLLNMVNWMISWPAKEITEQFETPGVFEQAGIWDER